MCGIFGIINSKLAAETCYYGIHALQHRGQESAGIISADEEMVYAHHGMGLVNEVFSDAATLGQLEGNMAIAHNRYSTTGASSSVNIAPLLFKHQRSFIAVAHNGNLVNLEKTIEQLESDGALFKTSTDTEIIVHLIVRSKAESFPEKVASALKRIEGAYSLLIMTRKLLVAARDPYGLRPMVMGKLGEATVFASETCAFDLIGAEYIRDVEPGEIIAIDRESAEIESFRFAPKVTPKHCIFEMVYFSRPDSRVFGDNVDRARRKLGKNLAIESDHDHAHLVLSVPDSSNTIAIGFARRSEVKFDIGLIRNHYVGRTFIAPLQSERDLKVHLKFNTVKGVLEGRNIILVDDSIVRGTTLKKLIKLLREAGVKEVHVRIASPPISHPCYYGLDFPTHHELVTYQRSLDEICAHIGADSLHYLSVQGLLESMAEAPDHYCTACFTGKYPIPVTDKEKPQDNYINEI
jgi:amidophosphoribosyltransferase